jgi:hypothetical protein
MYKNLLQTNVLLVKQNSDLTCEINCLNKQNYDLKCEIQELQKQLGKPEYEQIPELHIKEYDNIIDDFHESFKYETDDEFIEEFKPEEPQPEEPQPEEPEPQPEEPEEPEEPQPQQCMKVKKIIPCLKCGLKFNCSRCKRKNKCNLII